MVTSLPLPHPLSRNRALLQRVEVLEFHTFGVPGPAARTPGTGSELPRSWRTTSAGGTADTPPGRRQAIAVAVRRPVPWRPWPSWRCAGVAPAPGRRPPGRVPVPRMLGDVAAGVPGCSRRRGCVAGPAPPPRPGRHRPTAASGSLSGRLGAAAGLGGGRPGRGGGRLRRACEGAARRAVSGRGVRRSCRVAGGAGDCRRARVGASTSARGLRERCRGLGGARLGGASGRAAWAAGTGRLRGPHQAVGFGLGPKGQAGPPARRR